MSAQVHRIRHLYRYLHKNDKIDLFFIGTVAEEICKKYNVINNVARRRKNIELS